MLSHDMFKANDIRGIVVGAASDGVRVTGPEQWDEDGARVLGACYVDLTGLAGKSFVLGRDMRLSGPRMCRAFAEGAVARGAHVIDVGLVSTDQLWYASGSLDLPGVQFTASHNPPDYNGIKFCEAAARPVTSDFLAALRDAALGVARSRFPQRGGDQNGSVSSAASIPGCVALPRFACSLDLMRAFAV